LSPVNRNAVGADVGEHAKRGATERVSLGRGATSPPDCVRLRNHGGATCQRSLEPNVSIMDTWDLATAGDGSYHGLDAWRVFFERA
jgi:hypothetical protein